MKLVQWSLMVGMSNITKQVPFAMRHRWPDPLGSFEGKEFLMALEVEER